MPNSYSFIGPNPRERIMPNYKVDAETITVVEDDAAEAFDPGDHSIADVKAYIEANPDELDDVLAAEEAGKGRVTLIEWLTTYGD
jgi:hypothetical protein